MYKIFITLLLLTCILFAGCSREKSPFEIELEQQITNAGHAIDSATTMLSLGDSCWSADSARIVDSIVNSNIQKGLSYLRYCKDIIITTKKADSNAIKECTEYVIDYNKRKIELYEKIKTESDSMKIESYKNEISLCQGRIKRYTKELEHYNSKYTDEEVKQLNDKIKFFEGDYLSDTTWIEYVYNVRNNYLENHYFYWQAIRQGLLIVLANCNSQLTQYQNINK